MFLQWFICIYMDIYMFIGGRSSVVIVSEFKSEDPEFHPLVEQGKG